MEERVGRISVQFHLLSFLVNVAGVYYDVMYTYLPVYSKFGGRGRFLTRIVEMFSLLYTGFALFADVNYLVRKDKNKKPTLIHVRDFVFATLVFPLSIMVPLLFWGIALVDLDGLVPLEHREKYPLTGLFNNFLHTWPLVFCLGCSFLIYHGYPRRLKGLTTICFASTAYVGWMFVIRYVDGVWVYRFLGKLSPVGFTIFLLAALAVTCLNYIVGEYFTKACWSHLKEKLG